MTRAAGDRARMERMTGNTTRTTRLLGGTLCAAALAVLAPRAARPQAADQKPSFPA